MEEHALRADPLQASQQRLAELRRQLERARREAAEAQRADETAQAAQDEARRQLDAAIRRRETTERDLNGANQRVTRAQAAFEREAGELERVRRGRLPRTP